MITLKSKTHIWGMLLGIFGGLQTVVPAFQEHLPSWIYGPIFIFVMVVTIILRNVTTKPVSEK